MPVCSQGDFSPTRTNFHVFVVDPVAACARTVEHGATLVYEVMDHDYGERSGGVEDRFGHRWQSLASSITKSAADRGMPFGRSSCGSCTFSLEHDR